MANQFQNSADHVSARVLDRARCRAPWRHVTPPAGATLAIAFLHHEEVAPANRRKRGPDHRHGRGGDARRRCAEPRPWQPRRRRRGCARSAAFDDGSSQDVATTVGGGLATVPTNLWRARLIRATLA